MTFKALVSCSILKLVFDCATAPPLATVLEAEWSSDLAGALILQNGVDIVLQKFFSIIDRLSNSDINSLIIPSSLFDKSVLQIFLNSVLSCLLYLINAYTSLSPAKRCIKFTGLRATTRPASASWT